MQVPVVVRIALLFAGAQTFLLGVQAPARVVARPGLFVGALTLRVQGFVVSGVAVVYPVLLGVKGVVLACVVVAGIAVVYCCTHRRRSLSRTSSPNYNNVGVVVMLSRVVWNL